METFRESDLVELLNDMLAVQDELLATLTKKRELLASGDTAGLTAIAPREEELVDSLQQCLQRRNTLLGDARQAGLPSASIRALSSSLPRGQDKVIGEQIRQAGSQARLLKHHCLTNWVVVQRTLIHLSQMLEIVATGGRLSPTYGEGEPVGASGSLMDGAA